MSGHGLEGKVVVVTGAASGIGRSMVRRFVEEGGRVVAVDVDAGRLGKVVGELGEGVTARALDVGDRCACERLVAETAASLGGLHVLCNNAGVVDDLFPAHDTSDDLWDRVIAVNLTGPFVLTRAALKVMVGQGGGAIVNTTSVAGLQGGRGGASYTVSKHGLVGLTRSVAWYYGRQGVRSNAIAPGAIQTRMQASMSPHPGGMAAYEPYFASIPAFGKALEVADAAVFLAGEQARFINGAVLPVDGGWMAY